MVRSRTALALLMSCSAIASSGCEKQRIAVGLKPPSDKLVCVAATRRPTVAPEYRIDWNRVTTVPQARAEHDRYVTVQRTREGAIAGYILQIEGQLFACSSNMQWLRTYFGTPNG